MGSHDETVAVITSPLPSLSSLLNMRSNYPVVLLVLLLHLQVQGDPDPGLRTSGRGSSHQEQLTKYLLSKLLGSDESPVSAFSERRNSESSYKFPVKARDPLQKLLDHAKANIDVIDFRNPNRKYYEADHLRLPRQPQDLPTLTDDLTYGSQPYKQQNPRSSSPSEASLTFLPFPGNEKARPTRQAIAGVSPAISIGSNEPFSMPLQKLGGKEYYIGIFFKANWYKAEQYCRYHGMHLASINSAEEQASLEDHITSFGMGNEHFWSSGTDQGEEGKFVWMSTGKPLTYENWNAGEPNNFRYEGGETENCLELWNRDGKGLRWNDTPCSFESYFLCEV